MHVRTSKSGKGRHIVLNDEGAELFKSLAAGKLSPTGTPAASGRWRDHKSFAPIAALAKHSANCGALVVVMAKRTALPLVRISTNNGPFQSGRVARTSINSGCLLFYGRQRFACVGVH